jgi:hypothetical protein
MLSFWFWVFLCSFAWFCRFLCILLDLRFFLLQDDILEFFFGFWSSSCASWGLGFEIQTLCICCQCTHQRGDWETKWSIHWFDVWSIIGLQGFEFETGTFRWFYYYLLVSCGEFRLLVSWCAGDRCDMVDSDEDRGRSRRLGAEGMGWSSTDRLFNVRTIGRSGDIVHGLHHAQWDEERGFLG